MWEDNHLMPRNSHLSSFCCEQFIPPSSNEDPLLLQLDCPKISVSNPLHHFLATSYVGTSFVCLCSLHGTHYSTYVHNHIDPLASYVTSIWSKANRKDKAGQMETSSASTARSFCHPDTGLPQFFSILPSVSAENSTLQAIAIDQHRVQWYSGWYYRHAHNCLYFWAHNHNLCSSKFGTCNACANDSDYGILCCGLCSLWIGSRIENGNSEGLDGINYQIVAWRSVQMWQARI